MVQLKPWVGLNNSAKSSQSAKVWFGRRKLIKIIVDEPVFYLTSNSGKLFAEEFYLTQQNLVPCKHA
jgi:hypothetical protein